MASFDEFDVNGNGFAGYELEAGDYIISARRSSHEVVLEHTYNVPATIQCKTDYTTGNEIAPVFVDDYTTVRDSLTDNMLSRGDGMTQPAAETAAERVLQGWEADTLYGQEFYRPYNDEEGQDWYVNSVPATWTQEAATSVKKSDLSGVPYVESRIGDDGVVEATASDEGTQMWESYMNSLSYQELFDIVADPTNKYQGTDGPVAFGGATCWSSSPISAATWNVELVEEQGEMYGTEAIFGGRTYWNGGGVNIHRSPFNGRCFEYYSEDPLISGTMGAAVTKGVTSKGVVAFYKHFFANTQEYKRAEYGGVATFATEQTFREIYMKAFEMIVKAGSLGLMTSFNRIGYVVNSDNWAVHEDVLREEWGFDGATVTDMWAKNYVSLDLMARAGDDIVLGGSTSFTDTYFSESKWDAANNCVLVKNEDGNAWVASPTQYYAIRKSAQRVLYTEVNSNMMRNNTTNLELTATIYQGVSNTAIAECPQTSDFTLSVADGATLPAGITLNGFTVTGAASLAEGVYTIPVKVACDSWIETDATLTVNVVNMIGYNGVYAPGGATADNPLIRVKAGEAVDGTFSSEYYAYGQLHGSSLVSNYYYSAKYGWYSRDEDKSAADIVTHPAEEAEQAFETKYTVEGALPAGLTLTEVKGLVTGAAGSQFETTVGYKLSGTPTTAGVYTVTITLEVPQVTSFNNWIFVSFGRRTATVSRTVTIVVE